MSGRARAGWTRRRRRRIVRPFNASSLNFQADSGNYRQAARVNDRSDERDAAGECKRGEWQRGKITKKKATTTKRDRASRPALIFAGKEGGTGRHGEGRGAYGGTDLLSEN